MKSNTSLFAENCNPDKAKQRELGLFMDLINWKARKYSQNKSRKAVKYR